MYSMAMITVVLANSETKCLSVPTVSVDCFPGDPILEQDDSQLLRYIAKYHLEPPSTHRFKPVTMGSKKPSPLSPVIQAIFKEQRIGVFVEAGGFNDDQESNTLFLERDFGWSGVLVDGNPFSLTDLRLAFRRAWIGDVCLAATPYAQKDIISAGYVECFPVFSILAALNITTVDYLSLDVEAAELKVLQNIPFDRVNIKVFSVEHWIVSGGIQALDTFFMSKNYERIGAKGGVVFYTQAQLLPNYKVNPEILDTWPLFMS